MIRRPSADRIRPFGRAEVWAPTGDEAAALDRRAIDSLGIPERVLLESAGRALALVVARLYPEGPVVALAGSGNNGGDAVVAARILGAWGREVQIVRAADRPDPDPLLHGQEVKVVDADSGDFTRWIGAAAVLLDGILGTGIEGAPRDPQAEIIRAVNRSGTPVVAVDLPSGVDAGTGSVPGEAVQAAVTVGFGWPKRGALFYPGRGFVGRLLAVEIGFPPPEEGELGARLFTPGWADRARPVRKPDTHKNEVGRLLLLAGSRGMAGAAVLAARAAFRSGVGLLRVASAGENREIVQTALPEALFVDADDPDELTEAVSASEALALGPGLGRSEASERAMATALGARDGRPVVLDADALNLISEGRGPTPRELGSAGPTLLTPHPGEMTRLVDGEVGGRVRHRPDWAAGYAERTGCTVLLKGSPTVVAEPGGPVWMASIAVSDFAVAGMGDVLTGAAGSLLAQGCDPLRAAGLALHWTGRAALRADRKEGLVPGDVVEELPAARSERGPGDTELDLPLVLFDQDAPE